MTTTKSTTVVTRQVQSSGTIVTTGNRDWNAGLLGCCDDSKTAVCGLFCCPCFAGQVARRAGEHCCMPCFVPGGVIALRTKIRLMLSIKGTICNDCLMTVCCAPCAVCQMSRELDQAGWPK